MVRFLTVLDILMTLSGVKAMANDCGFVQNPAGHRISIKQNAPINFYFTHDFPADFSAEVVKAANEWNKAAGRKLINIAGVKEKHNESTISMENILGGHEFATITMFWDKDNEIIGARIALNNYMPFSTSGAANAFDVRSVFIKSFGHALGLKSNNVAQSVMRNPLAQGEIRHDLDITDLNNLKCEYK